MDQIGREVKGDRAERPAIAKLLGRPKGSSPLQRTVEFHN